MKQEAINRCMEIAEDPYSYLKSWKEKYGKKIIACFAMHIPEELIHASGMLPVVAWRSNEPVSLGHAHVAPYNCGLTRSFIDDMIKGKLDFLDGIVVHRMCLQSQGLPFILEQNVKLPYFEYLSLPPLYKGAPFHDFFVEEAERFKKGLEAYLGRKITFEDISHSIEIYNENRRLLQEIYEIRREKPGAIKASEMVGIVQSTMLMPKEESNILLKDVIEELQQRTIGEDASKKLPVVIYGCLCQRPQFELLDLIEDLGMVVVNDDIFVGSKYFANQVEIGDNPIEALANRYMKRIPPCPTKGDIETDWTDYIIKMVQENDAKGVISLMIKYCPPHMCYYPDIKNKLDDRLIPEILIEVEHEIVSYGQIRTRLQTFREIIGGM